MKKIMKPFIFTVFLLGLLTMAQVTFADPPLPPADHGQTGNGGPVGAPIDGGLGILLAMGATYGARKLYKAKKEKDEELTIDN